MATAAFRLSLADGTTIEVDTKPGDFVRFERQFNVSPEALGDNPRVEYLMFLGWAAAKRTGQTDLDFEAFLDVIDDFDTEEAAPLDQPNAS